MKKLLALALILALVVLPLEASVLLTATTEILELTTSSTSSTDYTVSYVDHTSSTFTPGSTQGNITTATTTTILSAPAASTQRQVKLITVRNKGTASQTVILKKDISGTEYFITGAVSLFPGDFLTLDSNGDFNVISSGGTSRVSNTNFEGYNGIEFEVIKAGTANEAAGVRYGYMKDAGLPGAWVPGTPGVNGATLDCSSTSGATTAGSYYIQNPATGSLFLTGAQVALSTTGLIQLVDPIWYNTGLTVTTTTAQSITLPTLPNRDLYGTNNGEGWNAAIYVTTATTNGSPVTNTTLSYTDSDGNTGNTATIPSFPATAVVGSWIPFHLAAGDRGIRDIASVTLGTSYVTGAISLVLYRVLNSQTNIAAYAGGTSPLRDLKPGIRVYNGSCIWYTSVIQSTTNTSIFGSNTVLER